MVSPNSLDSLSVPEGVYAPREDSLLLAFAVRSLARGRVLDIGTGSGIASIAAAQKPVVVSVTAVDVNPDALECAQANAEALGVDGKIVFLESDLFSALGGEKFDCICFNPPYLPTSEEEHVKGGLDAAFDGGPDGRRVTDAFIPQAKAHLNAGGIVLLVSSSLADSAGEGNGNAETLGKLEAEGFKCEILVSQKFSFEELAVISAVLV
jgi:release factor glutamine methyltransferase